MIKLSRKNILNYARYTISYTTTLDREYLKFVCENDIVKFNKARLDDEIFSRYYLPSEPDFYYDINKLHDMHHIEEITITSEDDVLRLSPDQSFNDIDKYYSSEQYYSSELLKNLIGTKVDISYTIDTVIYKFAHIYSMFTEHHAKGLTMLLNVAGTGIPRIRAVPYFNLKGKIPKPVYSPSKGKPISISFQQIATDELVMPRSGVVFAWRLSSDEPSSTN